MKDQAGASDDPGGRSRLALPDGVRGWAAFSDCGRYRHALGRDLTAPGATPRSILFVGLNPSVASGEVSDPTCHREYTFARDWGYNRYLKANILDWRAMAPRDIPRDPQIACSPDNLPTLARLAAEAETLVMASGNVAPVHGGCLAEALACLRDTGKPIYCLGQTKSGAARHPLYLRRDTPLQPFLSNGVTSI